jgi:hypothetical protein
MTGSRKYLQRYIRQVIRTDEAHGMGESYPGLAVFLAQKEVAILK